MYLPPAFTCTDDELLLRLMEQHPFATLIATAPAGIELGFAPCLVSPGPRLRFHLARTNPLARALAEGAPLTAIFHGPDAYVSAAWYGEPTSQVPTWNYAAVVVHGERAVLLDGQELLGMLDGLGKRFDKQWSLADANPALVRELTDYIVGFELPVVRLEGKLKLSQNRSAEDRARVQTQLAGGAPGERAVADLMRALGIA